MVSKETNQRGQSKILFEIAGEESEYVVQLRAMARALGSPALNQEERYALSNLIVACLPNPDQLKLEKNDDDDDQIDYVRTVKVP